MANTNCNCPMSLLKKQCPREPFDCHRCMAKMKNTRTVWEIATAQEINAGLDQTFPAFISKLYYDTSYLPYFWEAPDGVTLADIRCINGFYGRMNLVTQDLDFYRLPPIALTPYYQQLSAAIYFETTWRLWLRYDQVFDGLYKNPGDATFSGNQALVAEAHYVSEESNCFVRDLPLFTLESSSGREYSVIDDTLGVISQPDYSFPENVSFHHVDALSFNPLATFKSEYP